MKKIIILCSFLGILLLIGCTEQADEYKVNVDLEISEIEQKIQNLSLYEPLTDEDINRLTDCDKGLLGPIESIKKLNLYKSERFNLIVLAVPDLQDTNINEFNNWYIEKMCDGLGQQNYLLTLDEHLLTWDPIGCGFEIGELWRNETEDSKACAEINNELIKIKKSYTDKWLDEQNFDDLSACGDFTIIDNPKGMDNYLVCRKKWDGECYYKHLTYAETMGCYFEEGDNPDEPFECMKNWVKVWDSEGNIKHEKIAHYALAKDDHCKATSLEYFESIIN